MLPIIVANFYTKEYIQYGSFEIVNKRKQKTVTKALDFN